MSVSQSSSSKQNSRTRGAKAPPAKAKSMQGAARSPYRAATATLAHLSEHRYARIGALAAISAGLAGAGYMAWREYRARASETPFVPAAFRPGETDPENFSQTRSAGVEAIRDQPGGDWDRVDQAIDESFPASDPMTH